MKPLKTTQEKMNKGIEKFKGQLEINLTKKKIQISNIGPDRIEKNACALENERKIKML